MDSTLLPSATALECLKLNVLLQPQRYRRTSFIKITTIGINLAKNVPLVHGSDVNVKPFIRKQPKRDKVKVFLPTSRRVLSV